MGDALAMKSGVTESIFGGFGAAIVQVNIVFPGEAHAAVNLDAAIADALAAFEEPSDSTSTDEEPAT